MEKDYKIIIKQDKNYTHHFYVMKRWWKFWFYSGYNYRTQERAKKKIDDLIEKGKILMNKKRRDSQKIIGEIYYP